MKKLIWMVTSVLVLVASCKKEAEKQSATEDVTYAESSYPIEPVNIQNVKIKDEF